MIRMVVMIIEANIDDNGNYYEIKKNLFSVQTTFTSTCPFVTPR